MSIYREDLILSDSTAYQFTTRPREHFTTFSEHFRKKFPGYKVDRYGACTSTTAKTLNYRQVMDMLKSKDEGLFHEMKWIFDGEFRFLDGESLDDNRVGFTSFPRSGNSFLRRTLEQISGITTGGTMHLHTATSLQIQGLKGEAVYDNRVWISKTHHPLIIPYRFKFYSNKLLLCVRNPLDIIPSYASFCNTMNHGIKPDFEYEKDYPQWWDMWIKTHVPMIKKFYDVILDHCMKESK